jgi:hypothetical protein
MYYASISCCTVCAVPQVNKSMYVHWVYQRLGTAFQYSVVPSFALRTPSIFQGVKVSKAFHRDAGPCWCQCFPQLGEDGWMSYEWWTIVDTHGKLFSVKNPAALHILTQTVRLAPSTISCSKALQYFVFPFTLWMSHIHNPCLNCLKASKSLFNHPFIYTDLKWNKQVTSIRDHSFYLDSPGQSISWKEQLSLMFCTLSVWWVAHFFTSVRISVPLLEIGSSSL